MDRYVQAALEWARTYTGKDLDQMPLGEPGEGPYSPLARAAGIRLWWRDSDLDGIPFAIFYLADGEEGFWNDTPERQITGDVAEFVRRFERGLYMDLWSGQDAPPPSYVIGEMRGFHHLGDSPPDVAQQAQVFLTVTDAQQRFDQLTAQAPPAPSGELDDDLPF